MGDGLTHLVGKGCRAAFDLGCLQQVTTGLVENHTAEAVGQHDWHLSSLHVVSPKHGACALADLSCTRLDIPGVQVIRSIRAAVTTTDAGAMVTIGGKHRETTGLVQANIAGEGSIRSRHQNFLPITGVTATTHLQMLSETFKLSRSLQQPRTCIRHGWAGVQPGLLGLAVVTQGCESLEAGA